MQNTPKILNRNFGVFSLNFICEVVVGFSYLRRLRASSFVISPGHQSQGHNLKYLYPAYKQVPPQNDYLQYLYLL